MPNPSIVPITQPRVPFLNPETGFVSMPWYRFLLSLNQLTSGSEVSLGDLQKGPPTLTIDEVNAIIDRASGDIDPSQDGLLAQIAELQKQVDALEIQPVLQIDNNVNTFETVSKNLKASGAALAYDMAGNLTSITYANGVVKTLNYDMAGNLTSIVLSGNIPPEILTVKTLTYDMAGNLTSTSYS